MSSQNKLLKSLFGSKLVAPLGGKRLKREVKASANLRYGPELRDIKKERRISRRQQQRSADWFADYQNKLGEIQSQNQGAYATASQQIGQNAEAAAARTAGRIQSMEADRAATNNTFGLRADPTAGNVMAQASQVRSRQAESDQARVQSQGATQFAYLGSQKQAGHKDALKVKLGEVDRRQALRQQARDVKKEKGQFKQDIRRELRGGERQFLSDLLASKLGKKTLAESTRSAKAGEALTQQQIDARADEISAKKREEKKERAREKKREAKKARQGTFNMLDRLSENAINNPDGPDLNESPYKVVKKREEAVVREVADKIGISNPKARELVSRWLAKARRGQKGGDIGGSNNKNNVDEFLK